jgi:RNA polymerase sigma factor (sigma-70 family)
MIYGKKAILEKIKNKFINPVSFTPLKSVIKLERIEGVNRMHIVTNKKVEITQDSTQLIDLIPGLQRYCHFLSKNQWDGDDLVQETIMKASQKYPSSELSSALLNKIAYHHWIDTLRKRQHEVLGIPKQLSENRTPSHPNTLIDTVTLLLDQLTPKQAVILMLKEAFGYQSNEIANVFNTTDTAVKSILHRAKNRLSKDASVHTVWDEDEKQLLFDLLYESLKADDPKVLIHRIHKIPSISEVPKLLKSKHSCSPLNTFCLAA